MGPGIGTNGCSTFMWRAISNGTRKVLEIKLSKYKNKYYSYTKSTTVHLIWADGLVRLHHLLSFWVSPLLPHVHCICNLFYLHKVGSRQGVIYPKGPFFHSTFSWEILLFMAVLWLNEVFSFILWCLKHGLKNVMFQS
jgi:hypothetical protein